MTIAKAVAAGIVIVAVAACQGASKHPSAATNSPVIDSSSQPPTSPGPNPTALSRDASGAPTPSTTTSGAPVVGTAPPPTPGAIGVPGGSSVRPSLSVTSPHGGDTVGLPLVIRYRLTGFASTRGLSLRITIPPAYQVEMPVPALDGSISVPGSKTLTGLRSLTVITMENGVAVASPEATAVVANVLIVGGR